MTEQHDDIVTGGAWHGSVGAEVGVGLGLHQRFAAGDRVGPFRLLSELGEGGSSVVFLADRDNGTFEQQVALKLWRDASSAHRAALTESNLLGRLNHPNIARIIDAGLLGDHGAWLAMAHVEGLCIDQAAQLLAADWRQRLAWLQQVANAVHHAHQQLIAHGDIKPSNVLIDRQGQPCLLDFGIGQFLHARDGSIGCTPGYASPEQLRGEPITAASDVYQLGRLSQTLLPASLPMPSAVRTLLTALVSKAMATEPGERLDSAKTFEHELKRLRASKVPRSLQTSVWHHLALLWLRQSRSLIGAALVLALLGVLVWQAQLQRQQAAEQITRQQRAKDELARLNANLLVEALRSVGGDKEAFRNYVRDQQNTTLTESRLDPWVKYEILSGLANAHVETFDYPAARALIDDALRLRASIDPKPDLSVAYLRCLDAMAAALTGRINESRREANVSSTLFTETAAQNPELAYRTQMCLGSTYVQIGDVATGDQYGLAASAFAATRYGEESREYVEALALNAEVARIRMEFDRAVTLNRYVSARMSRWYGPKARRAIEQFIRMQGTRAEAGEAAAAEQALAAVIADLAAVGQTDNYPYHAAHYYRAEALQMLGRYDEAAASFEIAVNLLIGHGMEAPTLHVVSDQAAASRLDQERGQAANTINALRAALQFTLQNETDPLIQAVMRAQLADALMDEGDAAAEVGPLLDAAEPVVASGFGPNSFHTALTSLQRVRWLVANGQTDAARNKLQQIDRATLNPTLPAHARLLIRLMAEDLTLAVAFESPEALITSAEQMIAFANVQFGTDHPLTAVARLDAATHLATAAPAWSLTQLDLARPVLVAHHPVGSRYRRLADKLYLSLNQVPPTQQLPARESSP